MEEVTRAFDQAVGTWTGCDWPTVFGPARLDLNGITAAEAETLAVETDGLPEGEHWAAAARWLDELERLAARAEREAVLAVAEAEAGARAEAVEHARTAWSLEFHTGRPLRHHPPTWQRLYHAIVAAGWKQDW